MDEHQLHPTPSILDEHTEGTLDSATHPIVQNTWLEVDGLRIHCLTAGERGSAVVLLHGAGVESATLSWSDTIVPLSTRHRVFAPDLPGYGLSDKPDIQYTTDFYVNFVHHLLDVLHLEKVSLVGLSLGGGIALGFTLRFPERVEKLILVDTYGIQDTLPAYKLAYLYARTPLNELSYWLLRHSRHMVRWTLLAGLIYSPQRLSQQLVDKVYQAAQDRHAGKAFASYQRSEMLWHGLRTNFINRLPEIIVPTLIVHGAEDTAVPIAYAQKAHTLIKNSQLYILQGCRHWPQREKLEEFNRVVLNFLNN